MNLHCLIISLLAVITNLFLESLFEIGRLDSVEVRGEAVLSFFWVYWHNMMPIVFKLQS